MDLFKAIFASSSDEKSSSSEEDSGEEEEAQEAEPPTPAVTSAPPVVPPAPPTPGFSNVTGTKSPKIPKVFDKHNVIILTQFIYFTEPETRITDKPEQKEASSIQTADLEFGPRLPPPGELLNSRTLIGQKVLICYAMIVVHILKIRFSFHSNSLTLRPLWYELYNIQGRSL